jgi:hypothetical protein
MVLVLPLTRLRFAGLLGLALLLVLLCSLTFLLLALFLLGLLLFALLLGLAF